MSATDRIEKNFSTFQKLCRTLGSRREAAEALVDTMANEIATAPASTRKAYHDCYAGGLIEYSLRVLRNAKQLNTQFDFDCSTESMILVSLFHALGKAGDLDGPMYEPEHSDWHREKLGKFFKISDELQPMPWTDRSLYLLNHFGVELLQNEWIAIKMADGRYHKTSDSY
ncbi:hypothetical protein HN588_02620, partial [Candidatus Bathyarchaeota archaeon]|nr:hypothetical protein [Candidatus Bathyarchaeota archaeon]